MFRGSQRVHVYFINEVLKENGHVELIFSVIEWVYYILLNPDAKYNPTKCDKDVYYILRC